ncbi:hypothetical protein OKW43_000590 [Paraburkholderia sp. WC7.3g]
MLINLRRTASVLMAFVRLPKTHNGATKLHLTVNGWLWAKDETDNPR